MTVDYGYNQTELPWGDSIVKLPEIRSIMSGIKAVGGSRIRVECRQNLVKMTDAHPWANVDRVLDACDEFGLRPLVVVSPGQASGISAASYGSFCTQFAQRYGPAGTAQVNDIETINENNWSAFFSPTTAAAFADYQRAAYAGIKSVHPGSTVIVGGTAAIGTGQGAAFLPVPPFFTFAQSVNPLDWWQGLYTAGIKGFFDAVGFHWYTQDDGFKWHAPDATELEWTRLVGIRNLMVDQGDGDKQILITEMGYPYPTIPSLTTCRDYLKGQVEMILEQPWLGPFFIYAWRNSGTDTSNQINQFGMVDYAFQKKQPLYDYAATIAGLTGGGVPIVRPDPPTGLVVTAHTPSSITLDWDTSNLILIPAGPASVVVAGGAPTVTASSTITPAGSIVVVVSGGAPTVAVNTVITPTGSVLAPVSGGAPTVTVTQNVFITPAGAAAVLVSGGKPTVTTGDDVNLTPAGSVLVVVVGRTPTVTVSSNVLIAPGGTVSVVLAGGIPKVTNYRAHFDPGLIIDVNPASLVGSLVDGDPISSITPTAGTETGALTGSSTTRPTFNSNGVATGIPSMGFDGGGDRVSSAAWGSSYGPSSTATGGASAITLFVVIKATGGDFCNGTSSTNFLTARKTGTTTINAYGGSAGDSFSIGDLNNQWEVVCIVWEIAANSGLSLMRVNTVSGLAGLGTTSTGSAAKLANLRIGTNTTASGNFLNGEVARLMIVKGRVSVANIAQEMLALGSDYGITVT